MKKLHKIIIITLAVIVAIYSLFVIKWSYEKAHPISLLDFTLIASKDSNEPLVVSIEESAQYQEVRNNAIILRPVSFLFSAEQRVAVDQHSVRILTSKNKYNVDFIDCKTLYRSYDCSSATTPKGIAYTVVQSDNGSKAFHVVMKNTHILLDTKSLAAGIKTLDTLATTTKKSVIKTHQHIPVKQGGRLYDFGD